LLGYHPVQGFNGFLRISEFNFQQIYSVFQHTFSFVPIVSRGGISAQCHFFVAFFPLTAIFLLYQNSFMLY
jgi:hypothetical protein